MQTHDVVIVGGGLVGLTLGIALAKGELEVAVIDQADPAAQSAHGFDGRASAIASASARMLRALGLGATLDAGCAIRGIRVTDGLSPLKLHFQPHERDDALGIMVENRELRLGLQAASRDVPGLEVIAPMRVADVTRDETAATVALGDGRQLRAPVVIAADGRRSGLREAAGINVARWSYPQSALVTMLAHERPHGSIACELFFPSGPFALLPMPDLPDGRHRSALVWTVDARDAAGVAKLGPVALAAAAEAKMGGFLGRIEVIAKPVMWPLSFHHAERYHARRLILVGDSAHGIHPIAGQGLNMGLRDVAALAEVLIEGARTGQDLGAPELARSYETWRRADNGSVAFATDSLNRLFALRGRLPAFVRRIGLAAVDAVPPLKRGFMAAARGEAGKLPALLRGELP